MNSKKTIALFLILIFGFSILPEAEINSLNEPYNEKEEVKTPINSESNDYLSAHWNFENNLQDEVGGNILNQYGTGLSFVNGKIDDFAMNFTRLSYTNGGYLRGGFDFNNNHINRSVSIWFKIDENNLDGGHLVSLGTVGTTASFMSLWVNPTSIGFNGNWNDVSTEYPIGNDVWYHLVFTYSIDRNVKLYLNTELILDDYVSSNNIVNTDDITFGARYFTSKVESYFGGSIDHFHYYENFILEESEINNLYDMAYTLYPSSIPESFSFNSIIWQDDFESHSLGQIGAPYSIIYSGTASEDQKITSDYSYSNSKSFHVSGKNSWSAVIERLANFEKNVIAVNVKMMADSYTEYTGDPGEANTHTISFWNKDAAPWGEYYIRFGIAINGRFWLDNRGVERFFFNQTANQYQWYDITVVAIRDINMALVYLDGNLIYEKEMGCDVNLANAICFNGGWYSKSGWYDNVVVSESDDISEMFGNAELEAPILYQINPNPNISGDIVLSWSQVSAATSYSIYRDTTTIDNLDGLTPIVTNIIGNTYEDIGLLNGTYHYVVVASNSIDTSVPSNCQSVSVQIPPDPVLTVHLIGKDQSQIEQGASFSAFFMVENDNGVPINDVTIDFNTNTLGIVSKTSNTYMGAPGIIEISFDTSSYPIGSLINLVVPSSGTYLSDSIDLFVKEKNSFTWFIGPRIGNNLGRAGLELGGSDGISSIGADAKFGESIKIVSDGSNILELNDIYNVLVGLNFEIGVGGNVGPVKAQAKAGVGVAAFGEMGIKLNNIEQSSELINLLITRNILVGLLPSTFGFFTPYVLDGIIKTQLEINELTGFDYVESGALAKAYANIGAGIGFNTKKDSTESEGLIDFKLFDAQLNTEIELSASHKYDSNGKFVISCEFSFKNGLDLKFAFLGSKITKGITIGAKFHYANINEFINPFILPEMIEFYFVLEDPEKNNFVFDYIQDGKFNFLSVLNWLNPNDFSTLNEIKVNFRLFPKQYSSKIAQYAPDLMSTLQSGGLNWGFIDDLSNNYNLFKDVPIEFEIEGKKKSNSYFGINTGKIAGYSLNVQLAFSEEFSYTLGKGYISLSGFNPLILLTQFHNSNPEPYLVRDFILETLDPSIVVRNVLRALIPDFLSFFFDCPIHVQITDEQGRITGYKDGSWVAEIPGSNVYLNENREAKSIYVPKNGSYEVNIIGYDEGTYYARYNQYDQTSNSWRIVELNDIPISNQKIDTFRIESDIQSLQLKADSNKNVNFTVSSVSDDINSSFIMKQLPAQANTSYKISILNWEDLADESEQSVRIYIDTNGDGIFDEEYLYYSYDNPLKWVYIGSGIGIGGGLIAAAIVLVMKKGKKKGKIVIDGIQYESW